MFLKLAHTRLEVYKESQALALEVYNITKRLPDEEKYNMGSQLRRAALSVHLNIAEGSSRKSAIERKRYYEISRGSIIEIDSVIDLILALGYISLNELNRLGECIVQSFKLITGMIDKQ